MSCVANGGKALWTLLGGLAAGAVLAGCLSDTPAEERQRTLTEAREIALEVFKGLDGFRLEKQMEVGLAGRPAVRMEASWNHAGQRRSGLLYVVDHPTLFNVIHYTAPAEDGLYESGLPIFQKMMRQLKVIRHAGPLTVSEEGEEKVMRSPDLQLEIRYPASWVYNLDEVNRAVVFSGPREEATWLTTVNFSVIDKWERAR